MAVGDAEAFEDIPLSTTEARGAHRLGTSWPTTPQFAVARDCDASALLARQAEFLSRATPIRVSLTAIILARVAQALRSHPRLNSQFHQGTRRVWRDINIGVAVATDQGLTVPVIRSADQLDEPGIAMELERLTTLARTGRLALRDVTAGTFTVTNLGMIGVDEVLPIVNPPQAAILGVGTVRDHVVAVAGAVVIRPQLKLAVCADHRVVDGVAAGSFLGDLARALEAP